MSKEKGPTSIEMTEEELNHFQKRIADKQLLESDYALIGKMIEFVIWVQIKLQHSKISLNNLKRLLFGKSSEKSKKEESASKAAEPKDGADEGEGLKEPDEKILGSGEKKSLNKKDTVGWRGARTRRMKLLK